MAMDLPYTPENGPQVVVVAEAHKLNLAPLILLRYDAVLGYCKFAEYGGEEENWDFRSAINAIAPLGTVADYLKVPDSVPLSNVRVSVLENPSHGTLRMDPDDPVRGKIGRVGAYHYFPSDPDYRGKDRMTFEIEANNKRFKVVVTVFAVGSVDRIPEKLEKRCPLYYRISTSSNETNLAERLSDSLWSLASLDSMTAIESLAAVASSISLVLDESKSKGPGSFLHQQKY